MCVALAPNTRCTNPSPLFTTILTNLKTQYPFKYKPNILAFAFILITVVSILCRWVKYNLRHALTPTHLLTHALTLTYSLTHPPTRSLIHSLTHSLTLQMGQVPPPSRRLEQHPLPTSVPQLPRGPAGRTQLCGAHDQDCT